MTSRFLPPPSPTDSDPRHPRDSDDEDADTASQLSIPLSSPPRSRRNSTTSHDPRESFASSSSSNRDSSSGLSRHLVDTPQTSVSPTSIFDGPKEFKSPTYPPTPPRDDTMSISSFASTSSRKTRPESLIIAPTNDPMVLGVALVDFNHLVRFVVQFLIILSILDFQVGPRIEYSRGKIFEDEEVSKILPFLALPDGAHLVCASCNIS
jgi:hypothetical protein